MLQIDSVAIFEPGNKRSRIAIGCTIQLNGLALERFGIFWSGYEVWWAQRLRRCCNKKQCVILIQEADPQSRFSHMVSVRPSIPLFKTSSFQVRIVIIIGGAVAMTEGIIDDTLMILYIVLSD